MCGTLDVDHRDILYYACYDRDYGGYERQEYAYNDYYSENRIYPWRKPVSFYLEPVEEVHDRTADKSYNPGRQHVDDHVPEKPADSQYDSCDSRVHDISGELVYATFLFHFLRVNLCKDNQIVDTRIMIPPG